MQSTRTRIQRETKGLHSRQFHFPDQLKSSMSVSMHASTLIPILLWCSNSCKSLAWYDWLRCCSSRSTRNYFSLAVYCSTRHLSSWEHCKEDRHWCPNAIQGATDNEFLSSMPRVSPSCRRSCANVCFSSSALYSRRDLRLFFSSRFSLPIRICRKF